MAKGLEYLRLLVAAQVPLHPTILSEQETVYMCKFCVEYTNTASLVSVHSEESCPFKACVNLGKRKLPEADKQVGGAAVGRKVVPMAKPQQGGVRDEAARQKRMAEGQALVNEWARQGRLPDGLGGKLVPEQAMFAVPGGELQVWRCASNGEGGYWW